LIDLKTTWGFRLIDSSAIVLNPYLGLGYHYWSRNIAQDSGKGLREDYQWAYVPLGVRSQHQLGADWNIGTDLSLLIPFWGSMRLQRVDDARVDLGSEIGFRAEVPLTMPVTEKVRGLVMPWYQYSAIGKSSLNDRYGFYEPASKTYEYGLHLGITGNFL
jgi:hypothetical protein